MSGIVSTFCNGASACLEVDEAGGVVTIRNTANLSNPVLCTLGEWLAFIEGVKAGDFDGVGQREREGAPLDQLPETVTA